MTTNRRLFVTVMLFLASIGVTSCGGGDDGNENASTATTAKAAAPKTALTIYADTVFGTKNLADADKATKACVLASRYPRNSQVVWRARVLGSDGTAFDDTKLDAVTVKLGDGQTFPMKYGPHPKTNPTDAFWAVSWTVPSDYATGSLKYSVSATAKDGAAASFEPFNVAPSLLTITDEVVPIVAAAG